MASLQSDVNKVKELVEMLAASRAELPVCSTSPRPVKFCPFCSVERIGGSFCHDCGKEYPAVPSGRDT